MSAIRAHSRRSTHPVARPRTDGDEQRRLLGVPSASLVVLAGLPGAGKTTLLRRLAAGRPAGVRALDAEEVAHRLAAHAGRVPYPALRPLVHGLHLLRVLRASRGPAACVLTTDPMTSPARRALLRLAARTSGRRSCVVLLDATAEQARRGQAERGRALGPRRMARHVVRAQRLLDRLHRGGGTSFADEVLVLALAAARTTSAVAVGSTRLSLQRLRRSGD